jgi:hypothetical protein
VYQYNAHVVAYLTQPKTFTFVRCYERKIGKFFFACAAEEFAAWGGAKRSYLERNDGKVVIEGREHAPAPLATLGDKLAAALAAR